MGIKDIKLPRPKCEKDGFCQQRDWEGRCLEPDRGCEWNEYVRTLLRAKSKGATA